MSYQVLARKWRPQKFSDVVGQQHVITALINSFSLNKIHHAYIFIGTRGIGKTTIARLFSKGLNCEESIVSDICGKCKNCKDVELGCFADLIEIDAASRTKVEETREFLDNVQYMPLKGRFKIYLIDEVHMLSKHSFNALLKVLEEPPMHVKFILITTEYKKIPKTVLSRCLQFYLKPLNTTQITEKLKYIFNIENIVIHALALRSLAYAAKGSMRDALNLAEQAIVLGNNEITSDIINSMFGIINIEYPLCLIENLIDGNINNILHHIDHYETLGVNWDYLLVEMLIILKKIAINQFLSNSSALREKNDLIQCINQRMHKISKRVTPENIQLYYQILLLGRRDLPYAPSYRIGIEITMLRALAFKPVTNDKIIQKNDKSFPNTNEPLNINFLKNSNINDKINKTVINNLHKTSKKNLKNKFLYLNINHQKNDFNHATSNTDIVVSQEIVSNTTEKLLKARLTLSKYKEYHKLHDIKKTPYSVKISQKENIGNILKRFSDINININKYAITCINEINVDNSKNLEIDDKIKNMNHVYKKYQDVIPVFIKKILQQAIKHDPWILEIYRLSLPKLAKKLAMNSWKEEISENKICLHLRPEYFYLNSVELKNIIQKSFSEHMGKLITLYIQKDTNAIRKTPIEYIHILYQEKMLEIKKKLSFDPHIKMIKNFFDIELNEHDIQIF